MADNTGAPHFIPYVEPTDLVREYPAADEASAFAVAAALDGIPVLAGIGSNVVQTVKTDVFSSSVNSLVDVTGLTVTITPTSSSSKVLVMFTVPATYVSTLSTRIAQMSLFRGATNLVVPDSPGSRNIGLAAFNFAGTNSPQQYLGLFAGHFMDSPATDSPVTYSIRVRVGDPATTLHVNRTNGDSDLSGSLRGVSLLTAIEVAA